METMYVKVCHPDAEMPGLLTTSANELVVTFEQRPDEIIAVHSSDELRKIFERYPDYIVSHRAKRQDARSIGVGTIFNAMAR